MKNQDYDYINETYGVKAYKGKTIKFRGEKGVIRKSYGHALGILLDSNSDKILRVHPTWEMEYLEGIQNV